MQRILSEVCCDCLLFIPFFFLLLNLTLCMLSILYDFWSPADIIQNKLFRKKMRTLIIKDNNAFANSADQTVPWGQSGVCLSNIFVE